MTTENKNPDDVFDTIESSLEERTGRDRRKTQVTTPYLNPDLERRKGDRRENGDQDE